jgi:glycosyltransferase involved in cell wall biosynthesis
VTVSVIIPLYNKAAHIRRTIDSVLTQTHGDFELIIVDDGSTDGGADIVRECADPRVRLVQQTNAGASAARNRGAAEAKSELLSFLDADDEWNKDFLETMLNLRQKFPQAAVWGSAYTEIHPGGRLRDLPLDEETRRQTGGLLINVFRLSVSAQQPIHASSMLVRKDALMAIGGYLVRSQPREDTDVLFRLALRNRVAYCPISKTIYHMDAENRLDRWLWSGNYPLFEHAREYLRECGDGQQLGEDVKQYLAHFHTRGLYSNWLAGNPKAMREIIHDCKHIKGYRLKCLLWRPLVSVPYRLVLFAWRVHSRLRGRDGKLPPVRRISRDKADSREQKVEGSGESQKAERAVGSGPVVGE